ncbi:MAG: cation:proton antiporter [Caldiserica bacterium]|nr:MAG: cation:proton antiporter [Caldisericota bacterium]
MIWILTFILFAIGVYGVVCKRNLVKIILGFMILDYAINLFLILIGYRKGGIAPIISQNENLQEFVSKAVDPLPQALVLTSIVIGLAITALFVAIAIRIYEKFGTFDISKIKELKG